LRYYSLDLSSMLGVVEPEHATLVEGRGDEVGSRTRRHLVLLLS